MNKVVCIACNWKYEDTKGMGIHRPPITCPECGGKVRIIQLKE